MIFIKLSFYKFYAIHIGSLLLCSSLMNFSQFPISVDYIITCYQVSSTSTHLRVLPLGIVVELYLSVLAADCPLVKCLGFNLAPSTQFFLLSSHSRLYLYGITLQFEQFQEFPAIQRILDEIYFHHSTLFTNVGGGQHIIVKFYNFL